MTKSEKAYLLLKQQLEDIFPRFIQIDMDTANPKQNHYDLVVATYQHEKLAAFPKEKVVITKRTIHVSDIERLLQLPSTSVCYVASNTYEASLESIEMLNGFGVGVKMFPYPHNEAEISEEITTVITFDRKVIHPERFLTVVEIGKRPIDFSTMIEISFKLKLPIHTQNVYKAIHLNEIVQRKNHDHDFKAKYMFSDIIGSTAVMKDVMKKAARFGSFDHPILIFGENGTGKELFAHSIHQVSNRRNQPFVPINFAGLPESLAESELFGYEDGAFTGAKKGGKPGLFQLAHNGTIFLDEIGDASLGIQAALLRVLQESQILRVGGTRLIPINVRIIAATNKDLVKLVEMGSFREDLYHRLCVLPLHIPSLRERKEDIIPLMETFFEKPISLETRVRELLYTYPWPGNVRELKNTVSYLTSNCEDTTIAVRDLPQKFLHDDVKEKSFIDYLETEGNLKEFFTILSYLQTAGQKNWKTGRTTMENYFKIEKSTPLTAQQIKSRMAILKKYHLVEIGSTRQGSWITAAGLEALKIIKNKLG
ncbi:sigma-54 interaction domain-containing protein [Pseudoneobacillus sp. C159]